jgi:hypothetical protein
MIPGLRFMRKTRGATNTLRSYDPFGRQFYMSLDFDLGS